MIQADAEKTDKPTMRPKSGKTGRAGKGNGECLRESERVVRRLVLNQPSGLLGIHPGWFRNTFSGQEYGKLRANILLWHRGRVYFQDSQDDMPACKSQDGLKPSPLIETPKSDACGHWNSNSWFAPECSLAAWGCHDGRRSAPPCQETWSFLGILEDDDLPFSISLKGTSLRSARRFLSMCYEVMRSGKHDLLDCCITLTSRLVQGRSFDYYTTCFSDPEWLAKSDPRHRKLRRRLRRFGQADLEATFDAEGSESPAPADVV